MTKKPHKCIIILSCKSSGSTALQNLLTKLPHVHHISKTRHFENETLYWTKAASILGMPQVDMLDSEVPIGKKKAKQDLITLLKDNLDGYSTPKDDRELIFDGWKSLCQEFSPVFLEKSPHHLHQWSSLSLIIECIKKYPEIDFLLIGLIRNPNAILYSAWHRWKSIPEKNQYEWLIAHKNLLKLKKFAGDNLVIVRYEDMVSDKSCLSDVFKFIDVPESDVDWNYLHRKSIAKWQKEKRYGFQLADEVIRISEYFGFDKSEMHNDRNFYWPYYKYLAKIIYKIFKPFEPVFRAIQKSNRP